MTRLVNYRCKYSNYRLMKVLESLSLLLRLMMKLFGFELKFMPKLFDWLLEPLELLPKSF